MDKNWNKLTDLESTLDNLEEQARGLKLLLNFYQNPPVRYDDEVDVRRAKNKINIYT